MRKPILTALMVSICTVSLHAAVNSDAFFPMDKGFSWVYNTLNKKNNDHFEMKVTMEDSWQKNVARAHAPAALVMPGMIMKQKDKRGTMREFLFQTENGIFIEKLGLSKSYTPEATTQFTPPVPRVIYPLVPGTKVHWEGRLKIAWVDKPIVFDGEVVSFEDITVPAGKFHCIKLHYHQKRGDEIVDEDAWYAEGVGQVKYDGGQYVKELKSYKKP